MKGSNKSGINVLNSGKILKKQVKTLTTENNSAINVVMFEKSKQFTSSELARMIDISAVQAFHGKKEIDEMVLAAKKYRFISVHTLPAWTAYLSNALADNPDILPGAPVGFPSGGMHTAVKEAEALQLIRDGVKEMDMVVNIGRLLSGDFGYVREEIRRIRHTAAEVPLKIILEVHYLSEDMIKTACDICMEEKADFIKTGTGWAPTGATLETVQLIARHTAGGIKIKASGGIRTMDTLMKMYQFGVARFGINLRTSIELIEACASEGR